MAEEEAEFEAQHQHPRQHQVYEHTIASIVYEHEVLRRAAAPCPPPAPATAAAATAPAPIALTLLEVVEELAELESIFALQHAVLSSLGLVLVYSDFCHHFGM